MAPQTSQTEEKPGVQENELSIGPFLKAEREKKGLTIDQLAGLTRLRRYVLKGIEAEDWGVLPAPVFVKGFIRSYARALGLKERDFQKRYEHIAALKAPPPRTLTKSRRSRGLTVAGLLLALIAVIVIILVWRIYRTDNATLKAPEALPGVGLEEGLDDLTPPEKPVPPQRESTPVMGLIQEPDSKEAGGTGPLITGQEKEPERLTTLEQDRKQMAEVSDRPPEPENGPLILKARVLENTWVRITVDDKAPKEYMFQPGSQPQWEAEKKFELFIGNAAGIEFEFDDRDYKNLGQRGQVIRLSFPEE